MAKNKKKPDQKMQAWIDALKRFGKEHADVILSIEEKVRRYEEKKARRYATKLQHR